MALRNVEMPGPGGYWLCPLAIADRATSSMPAGPSVSGKPWPRFTAPVCAASAVISAKIVEVKLDKEAHFGIDWSVVTGAASNKFGVTLRNDSTTRSTGNTGNVNFTFTGGTTTINAVLTALESQGDVRVLRQVEAG